MQLRMSPTGGMPELLAQHAGRAAVVGDGHDRGQVAGVLLEAAQQRREAGPAADRHDPRPAREEPLLVDELDERLVAVGRPERGHERPDRRGPHRRRRARRRSPPTIRPRSGERQELEGQQVDERAGRRRRARGPRLTWRRTWAHAEGEQEQPDEDDEEPALDADPGRQPAPQVHRPLELPVEDRDRPDVLLAQPGGQLLGDRRSSGGSRRCSRSRSSAASCPRRRRPGCAKSRKSVRGTSRNRSATGWPRTNARTSLGQPGERPQLRRRSTGSA